MDKSNQSVGQWGEIVAKEYLINKGYELVGKNIRNEIGEIDIVVSKNNKLYFVEVKTRTNLKFGFPEEAITARKYQRMFDCASLYLAENRPDWQGNWQIDLVSVLGEYQTQYPEIIHIEAL
jgi:putative endonuclease